MSNYSPTESFLHSWLTVKLLAEAEPSFTEAAIRNYVFNAEPRQTSKGPIPGNGLAPHIRRLGKKILLNHGGFLCWIDKGGTLTGMHPTCRPRILLPHARTRATRPPCRLKAGKLNRGPQLQTPRPLPLRHGKSALRPKASSAAGGRNEKSDGIAARSEILYFPRRFLPR